MFGSFEKALEIIAQAIRNENKKIQTAGTESAISRAHQRRLALIETYQVIESEMWREEREQAEEYFREYGSDAEKYEIN